MNEGKGPTTLVRCIHKAIAREHLSEEESAGAMEAIMSGEASPALIAAYLVALKVKGETADEIAGAARVMRAKATPVRHRQPLVADTCGTGGGLTRTFNISTAVAFVVAGAGLPVAKHGNRSFSSQSGSADVLEALGVNIQQSPEQVGEAIDRLGIGFLFAPSLHGAMKHAAPVRRELATDTIFNCLGPLTNPAGARAQVIGVYRADLVDTIARALARLGVAGAFVVHGAGGLDEISIAGPSQVAEVRDGHVRRYEIRPEDAGLPRSDLAAIGGGTPDFNASIVRGVLDGRPGPARDVVLLNAAAALVAAGRADTLADGVRLAADSIDSGAARAKLDALVAFTNGGGQEGRVSAPSHGGLGSAPPAARGASA